jgi:hypothetical protein
MERIKREEGKDIAYTWIYGSLNLSVPRWARIFAVGPNQK